MDIVDAMDMQYEIGQEQGIKVTLDNNVCVVTKRNWRQSIVYCQKYDQYGYGERLSEVRIFTSKNTDTRCLWILSSMLVCVK